MSNHDQRCEMNKNIIGLCECRTRIFESENAKLRAALKQIIDYGEALQPNPVHPTTFNACAIASEALSVNGEGKGL